MLWSEIRVGHEIKHRECIEAAGVTEIEEDEAEYEKTEFDEMENIAGDPECRCFILHK